MVSLPRLNVQAARVIFLLDTGADSTVLMPLDYSRMGIELSRDFPTGPNAAASGIGGAVAVFQEAAEVGLVRSGETGVDVFSGRIGLMGAEHHLAAPSLLGRDIFDAYRITYDRVVGLLVLNSRR